MRKFILAVVLLLFIFINASILYASVSVFTNEVDFTAAASPTRLINFEDINTSGGQVAFSGNEYTTSEGITYAQMGCTSGLWIYPVNTFYWNSNHLSPGNPPYGSGGDCGDSLTITFNPAVTAIGWTFVDFGTTTGESITAYDASNNVIYSNTDLSFLGGFGIGLGNNPFFGIYSPDTPIARIEIVEAEGDGDDVVYDNFRFSPVGQTVTAVVINGKITTPAIPPAEIGGVLIEQVSASPANSTTSSEGGLYNLTVPSNIPFILKLSKTGYVPTYSAAISVPANAAMDDFILFLEGQLAAWGTTAGNGIIVSKIRDKSGNNLSGVTVTAFSRVHSSYGQYSICYDETCSLTSTDASGIFYVKNVEPGDTITITAQKENWKFAPGTFQIYADAIHEGVILGAYKEILYSSFAGAGIWQWDSSSWSQLTPDSPEAMVASGADLYGDFGSNGLWQWNGSGWSLLTPDNPALMVAANSNLYASFNGAGIWQWNGSGWTQLTPDNPQGMVAVDINLYASFAGGGIWQWNGSGWSQLTPDSPEAMVTSGSNLYGDFGSNGLWQWNGSGWSLLTCDNPEAMVAAGLNLYGDFGSNGFWQWNGSGWSLLTPDNPEAMVASDLNLYGDFGGSGLWQWNGSGWTLLTPDNPASMVLGN